MKWLRIARLPPLQMVHGWKGVSHDTRFFYIQAYVTVEYLGGVGLIGVAACLRRQTMHEFDGINSRQRPCTATAGPAAAAAAGGGG